MTNVGYATLDVVPNLKGFQGQLERGTRGGLASAGSSGGTIFGAAAGRSAGSRFTSIFKNAAKAGLVGLAGAGALAIKFGGDAVSAASDLEESTNKVSQIFGKSADDVLKFTKGTADALGQSNTAAREAASTFGIFGSAAGLAERKNAKFAKRMTTLASDLASFNNTEPDEAVQALGAALRGESEPIRRFGVMLDEATLKAEAMRLGLLKPVKDQTKIFAYQTRVTEGQLKYNEAVKEHGKDSLEALKAEASLGSARDLLTKATEGTIPPLTQQQKLLAAQSEIFKQTEVAQGDFARTSDGLANQQRRLSARFEDAKAKLGKGLLPIMTDAADFLLDKGIPAFEDFSDWFNKKGIPAFKRFADEQGPRAVAVFEGIKDFAEDAKPFAEGIVKAFDDMPGWVKKVLVGGAVGGVAAKKLGLGSLLGSSKGGVAGGSGLLGLVSKSKPLPVFVTNPGGIGGTPGVDGKPKPSTLKNIGKTILPATIVATSLVGVDALLKESTAKFPEAKPVDFGASNDGYVDFSRGAKKELDGVQFEWDETRNRAADYFQLLYRNKNVQLRFTVAGIDLATQKARDYYATLLDIRALRLDFDTPVPSQPPNRSPGDTTPPKGDDGKGDKPTSRGVNVNIYGDVRPNDSKEFFGDLQRRSISGAGNGWG